MHPEVRRVESVEEAVAELASLGADAEPLAGGTWIMRAGMRGEALRPVYVALDGIAALHGSERAGDHVRIGPLVTHARLHELENAPALAGIRKAAALSAFPAVRNVATVGGNLAARGFAEADLVPALLAAEAALELVGPDSMRVEPLEAFLGTRESRPGELIARVVVPAPERRRSSFARLTVRGGGEYALASLAIGIDLADDGKVARARVAMGSVETRPRLCAAAAAALEGGPLTADAAEAAGEALRSDCRPREGRDAPSWYRRAVLGVLTRRVVQELVEGTRRRP